MSGALIVVEGPDYVGKSTTVREVSAQLTRRGVEHIVCREPGGTPFSDVQRQLVLKSERSPAPAAEVFAFLAAKADLLDKVIYPALSEGKVVLCDRFTRSLLAYQGGIRGFTYVDLIRLLAHGNVLVMPHLEILLTATPEVRAARRAARTSLDLMDVAGDTHSAKLAQGYADAGIYLFAQRTLTFDTSDTTVDVTAENVFNAIMHYLKFHGITYPSFMPITYAEWEERMAIRQDCQEDPALIASEAMCSANAAADGLSAL